MKLKTIDRFVVDVDARVGIDTASGMAVLLQPLRKRDRHAESFVVRECHAQQRLRHAAGILRLVELLEDSAHFYFFYENPTRITASATTRPTIMETTAMTQRRPSSSQPHPAWRASPTLEAAARRNHEVWRRNTLVDLLTYLKQAGRMEEPLARRVFAQLVRIVAEMHQQQLVHRDLKLPSVLVCTETWQVRLCNLGCTQEIDQASPLLTDRKGSPAYLGPEILSNNPYDGKAADVYALGVILYGMLVGGYPFSASSPRDLFRLIMSNPLQFPDFISASSRSLMALLLEKQPTGRPSAEQILQHPWFECLAAPDDAAVVPTITRGAAVDIGGVASMMETDAEDARATEPVVVPERKQRSVKEEQRPSTTKGHARVSRRPNHGTATGITMSFPGATYADADLCAAAALISMIGGAPPSQRLDMPRDPTVALQAVGARERPVFCN